MMGVSLAEQGQTQEKIPNYFSVKEAVFPFVKFPGVDPLLGPEMKSTGEVMGIGRSFGEAFYKSQLGAGTQLPSSGQALISVRDKDKSAAIEIARDLSQLGFGLVATRGTAREIEAAGIACAEVKKVKEGRPHIVDLIKNGGVSLIINTTEGKSAISDSFTIRRAALSSKVAYTTTLAGGKAICLAIASADNTNVNRLQELHEEMV